jgi:transcriptional regulator with XRE-family HTH domain
VKTPSKEPVIATVLQRRRHELGLNQVELSRRLGCSQQALSKWERGLGTIREKQHRKMLEALFDVPVAELEKENSPAQEDEAALLTEVPSRTGKRYDRE